MSAMSSSSLKPRLLRNVVLLLVSATGLLLVDVVLQDVDGLSSAGSPASGTAVAVFLAFDPFEKKLILRCSSQALAFCSQ